MEGQIHRLKLLKRQMYGRAGFALLRRRVLQNSLTASARRWKTPDALAGFLPCHLSVHHDRAIGRYFIPLACKKASAGLIGHVRRRASRMLTTSPIGQPARDGQVYARGSVIAGVVALAPLVWPVLFQFPIAEVSLIAQRPLKILQVSGMLPVMGVVVLLASISALVFGVLANPRTHWQAIVGLVAGGAALVLFVLTVTLSSLQGYLWHVGSSFSLIR